jgi:hypothetical protein
MTTARDFITLCLREAGVTGVGQTPLPEDITDGFTILSRMLSQWQKRRWLVPNLIDISALGNGVKSNLIGPGQYYNTKRPDKIQAAYFKQVTGNNNNVSYPLAPIWSYEDYAKIAMKELNSWPVYYFYDAAFPYGNVYIWPIPSSDYEIHLLMKGPINFVMQLDEGEITDDGSAYTNGAYVAVPFTNVSSLGNSGTANITVAGGVVTTVEIQNPGDGYKIGDILSVAAADIGGTGSGFLWTVTNVTADLDAEFNMPEEYEEAIHYNLVIRLAAHYQYDANPVHFKLAKAGLNTIKVSNTQISKLQMPSSLRFGNRGNSFYIYNADAQ